MNEEERFDFEQKHEEDLQRLRGFRLLDDDFMSKVFEDKNCVEFLLQIILKRDDLKVTSVSSQYVIKNLQGRSVRLDILAVDRQNQVYNIEIQRDDKGAGVKRVRYNSSLIDANVTEPGELVLFAVGRSFWFMLLVFLLAGLMRTIKEPVLAAWMNDHVDEKMRATVFSTSGQLDSFGQIIGGPIVGLVAQQVSIPWGLVCTAFLLLPALFLVPVAGKKRD